jgi:hypothetical protein
LSIRGQSPLPATWRLIRDGIAIRETRGDEVAWEVTSPGAHRVELWLDVAGEPLPWILANPFYVRQPD